MREFQLILRIGDAEHEVCGGYDDSEISPERREHHDQMMIEALAERIIKKVKKVR